MRQLRTVVSCPLVIACLWRRQQWSPPSASHLHIVKFRHSGDLIQPLRTTSASVQPSVVSLQHAHRHGPH